MLVSVKFPKNLFHRSRTHGDLRNIYFRSIGEDARLGFILLFFTSHDRQIHISTLMHDVAEGVEDVIMAKLRESLDFSLQSRFTGEIGCETDVSIDKPRS